VACFKILFQHLRAATQTAGPIFELGTIQTRSEFATHCAEKFRDLIEKSLKTISL
jgi:hypothetical protein